MKYMKVTMASLPLNEDEFYDPQSKKRDSNWKAISVSDSLAVTYYTHMYSFKDFALQEAKWTNPVNL